MQRILIRGFILNKHLEKLRESNNFKLQFCQKWRSIFVRMLQKMFEKSPLKNPLTETITCLNSSLIVKDVNTVKRSLNSCYQILVVKNSIPGIVADRAKEEFKKLCCLLLLTKVVNGNHSSETRLDNFWVQNIASAA